VASRWLEYESISASKVSSDIKHNRFYVDLSTWVDTRQALEYMEHLGGRCDFPVYATLQEIRLADDARAIRVGLAHTSEEALTMFPAQWTAATQEKQVPLGYMDNDQITVNRDVTWMIKDINPGLVGDYDQPSGSC
jgi:hypothetical protein